jgi:thymidylate synthase ThyX
VYTSERARVAQYVTDVDGDVFALTGLPEVVKGALFARYSRYGGSLKRCSSTSSPTTSTPTIRRRAREALRAGLLEYGDDSVAQLGGAHVALENVSNLVTKRIEWGRLAAYLEQSTRYIPYDTKPAAATATTATRDVMAGPHAAAYERELDAIFDTTRRWCPEVLDVGAQRWPATTRRPTFVYNNATKAKALDLLRGLLPAATCANVGMFASGQSYEQLLLRLRADELAESRQARRPAAHRAAQGDPVVPDPGRPAGPRRRVVGVSGRTTRDETRALADELVEAGPSSPPIW